MLVALHTKVSSQPETRFPRCTKPIYPHPFSRGLGLTQPLNSEKGLLMSESVKVLRVISVLLPGGC